MDSGLDHNARALRSKVYQHMLETRGWKYKVFLRYLRFFKYISFSKSRGEFLEFYYTLMRYIDDIVDGDAQLPKGYKNEIDFIEQKISFSLNPENPKDEVDSIMKYCFELAKKINQDFRTETADILQSLLFDAKRKGKHTVFPEKILMKHFHKMDISGTIKATLKLFKEDPNKYEILEPLGLATRYQFDLEDFNDDIRAGYLNFTKEEYDLCGIEKGNYDIHSEGIKNWFHYRATKGLELLKEHHKRLPEGEFKILTRITFPLVYELPAKRLFNKVLSKQ